MRGAMRLASLGLVLSISLACRTSSPPPIDICLGDGLGGADCVLRPGSILERDCMPTKDGAVYCPPMALKNVWMTTQEDMKNFAAWCHDVPATVAAEQMHKIELQAR